MQTLMWHRYGQYLTDLKDDAYRNQVFGYIEKEDSPKSLIFQIDCLKAAGFGDVEILHKNSCFATFGGVKRLSPRHLAASATLEWTTS
jgi:tRNA (cmo5U34)-methyltransferase